MAEDIKEVVDLTTVGELAGTFERPKSLERDLAGTEDIGAEDVRLPRLAIAQGLSPQITPGDARYIQGLTLFDLFNDLTEEVYGKGPITFVPVRRDIRRIEFVPRSEGGGIVDMDVPPNDPRLKWTVEDGVKRPPQATTFVEYVILMLRPGKQPEPIVLSIKGTNKENRRASDKITTVVKLRPPIYASLFKIDTQVPAKNDKGTFGVPRIKDAGFIPKDSPAGAALFAFAKNFHDSLEGKEIVVNREPGEDDFDTGETASTGDAADM